MRPFCSRECRGQYYTSTNTRQIQCTNCRCVISRQLSNIGKNNFCSQSCSGTYTNKHKTTGYRRSKLEKYLEYKLSILFSNLEIHYNRVDAINAELDIYIPSLQLAFELNGVFHYEPIYGEKKLAQTQNNDQRKFQACIENGISLCIIDTSNQKYFKESTSQKFLTIICDIINQKLSEEGVGHDPTTDY